MYLYEELDKPNVNWREIAEYGAAIAVSIGITASPLVAILAAGAIKNGIDTPPLPGTRAMVEQVYEEAHRQACLGNHVLRVTRSDGVHSIEQVTDC